MVGLRRPSSPHPDGRDPIEQHIALRLRHFRHDRGLTQAEVAIAIGVSFQQMQKYESGRDRISSSILSRVARALRVQFDTFFEGFDDQKPLPPAVDREAEKLKGAIDRISNPALRSALTGLITTLACEPKDDT